MTFWAEEQRRNLYEAQREWAEWVSGEFTEEKDVEVKRGLQRLARQREARRDEPD